MSVGSHMESYNFVFQLIQIGDSVFVFLLSIFALTSSHSRSILRLSALTPAYADARVSTGEWQKPVIHIES